MMGGWKRVNRMRPCEHCRRPDWCLYLPDGSACICPRTSEGANRDLGEAGFLFVHRDDLARTYIPKPFKAYPRPKPEPRKDIDWNALTAVYEDNARGQKVKLLAKSLGVSMKSLRRLGLGQTEKGGWTFPMYDECIRIIGIRIRANNGRKWAYPGSRNGLFVPKTEVHRDPLLICEGPTDVAALLDLGYEVIGRPSCTGGGDFILVYCADRKVVIVADRDGPGQDGALKLADRLWVPAAEVRIVTPLHRKDAREWVQSGGTRTAMDAVIANTKVHAIRKDKQDEGTCN